MEDLNDEDLMMYEESREIKETLWKIWDIINDKEVITKLLQNTTLIQDLQKYYSSNQAKIEKDDEIQIGDFNPEIKIGDLSNSSLEENISKTDTKNGKLI